MNSNLDLIFINRLNQHPKLRERMDALLNIVENAAGDCTKADAAELHIIAELRKLGNEALPSWAALAVQQTTERLRNQEPKLHGNGKKKLVGIPPSVKFRS